MKKIGKVCHRPCRLREVEGKERTKRVRKKRLRSKHRFFLFTISIGYSVKCVLGVIYETVHPFCQNYFVVPFHKYKYMIKVNVYLYSSTEVFFSLSFDDVIRIRIVIIIKSKQMCMSEQETMISRHCSIVIFFFSYVHRYVYINSADKYTYIEFKDPETKTINHKLKSEILNYKPSTPNPKQTHT